LAYDIYRSIAAEGAKRVDNLSFMLFRKNNMGENARELNNTFLSYFEQALDDIINANPEAAAERPKHTLGTTVFIIHGHDNELKTEVQLLLARAGVHAIVLHEQADMGRTIIDKLVEESGVAGYAIALLTPDDLIDGGQGRARQNVILEIGYFLGKIGKARLRMLVKQDVEVPSDLQGILYEKHDNSGAWKFKLLKEMRAVGINLDINAALATF
jgi:predicted nucleotide-binding protein